MSRLLQLRGLAPRWLVLAANHATPHACVSTRVRCHYEVLGVSPSAKQEEIKNAFLQLSKEVHPDTNPDDPHNHDRFVRLNQAYTILREPASRKVYDVERMYGPPPSSFMREGPIVRQPWGQAYARHQQQQEFWDRGFYANRDRSQDREVPEDQYYGIRGMRKVSNNTVLLGCLVFIVVGVLVQFTYFSFASDRVRKHLDQRDRTNRMILREVEETSRRNGHERQVELFRQRLVNRGILDESHQSPSKSS